MDVVLLSRIQFALNIGFHYFYPPLSIGLVLMIVIMEGAFLKTKKKLYREMAKFWTKIFALTFALGVATGLVQVFAFGNNWSRYAQFVGDVFGSALAAEGIFAFFLEAGFIGMMLFGWERFSPKLHYLSTLCVAIGAHFSAVWIVAANSWMQTPAGFELIETGSSTHAIITQFWDVIFNPSFIDRITHVILGCWLTGSFIIVSVSAFYMLKKRHPEYARPMLKLGLIASGIFLALQLVSADATARGVARNQPEKLAAIEGIYDTKPYTPLTLFGYVDTKQQKVVGLRVPALLSFLVYRNFETPVTGLNEFPEDERAPVQIVFQTYHAMIAMWGIMTLLVIIGGYLWWRKKIDSSKWTLRALAFSILLPYIANQTGWMTAEIGRQPWVVYHLLRTVDGISKSITATQVAGSLIMFISIYILLFSLFIFLMDRKIRGGPETVGRDDVIYRDPYSRGGTHV